MSVITELDNLLFSELSRCHAMFNELKAQINQLLNGPAKSSLHVRGPIEVIILYDDDSFDSSVVKNLVSEIKKDHNIDLVLIHSKEKYYQLKNLGARRSKGDIIVFLDGDIIPEENWLVKLLDTFQESKVSVATGQSYVDPYSLYAKAFALGWIFPLRSKENGVKVCQFFYANNLAFRKETFLDFSFPVIEGTSRGSCVELSKILLNNGIDIYRNNAARASHPPPNGLYHFVNRAMAQGRDAVFMNRYSNSPVILWTFRSFLGTCSRLLSILRNRKKVDLPITNVPVAFGIMAGYYFLYHVSQMLTLIAPAFMSKRFQL